MNVASRRPSWSVLSGLVVDRCGTSAGCVRCDPLPVGRQPASSRARVAVARLAVWVALACGFGRVERGEDDEIAGAVLCLARPSLRTAALAAAVVGAVFVSFAAWLNSG